MRIERLEVSGGFLDGLRLAFADGLNVLIGARGAGKTSVLELLRFALGVPAMTADADQAAHRQARAVLGDGTVSVLCSVQGEQLIFSRTGLDELPATSAHYEYKAPLIVSQNEIEAIGLDPASRREILDRLVDPLAWTELDAEDTRATIASLERRLERLRAERDEYVDQAAQLEGLAEQLAQGEREQAAVAEAVENAKPLQDAIAQQADRLGQIRAAGDAYRIAEEALGDWRNRLADTKLERPIPKLQSPAVEAQVSDSVSKTREHLRHALEEIGTAQKLVADARAETRAQQGEMQTKLKADAEQLEELQRGAGEVGRRVSALRQQMKELEGYTERVQQLEAEISRVVGERDTALDEAEGRSEGRYQLRKQCAADLTSKFHGRIEVRVDKSGEFAAYESALVSALQGSNLQYRPLAASLAAKVSPRELVSALEAADAGRIVRAAQISSDRAVRLVAHLQQQSIVDLLLAPLDDSVDFALLDGQAYKPTRNLSMGQRCTVVLPLLLAEERESILLDQPEDHLDNAFIVETLVEAIRERTRDGQVIVATHNANIPVLGEARRVIVLASDGRHGFVTTAAPLDDDDSVGAITTLMEGGREAFARRAAFYSEHDDGR
ncbi:MAG: AAA family ATPase [Candidatus Limnocylindria bacterium]